MSEISEIQPITEIESYANVLRRPIETAKKARIFTKNNQQDVLDDNSLDFTKNISNGNNNTYNQVPGTSGNINGASEEELDDFLERLNNFHPNLKFTHEHFREEINFLDVTVRVNHGEFITNLYCKPTDSHQYLDFESCHPSHTKSSIIFSQSLRMRRICSKKSDFVANIGKLNDCSRKGTIPRIWLTRKQKEHLKVLH